MAESHFPKFVATGWALRLWRRRWVRGLAWTLAALLVLSGAAWLGAPPLIKWQGQKIATEKLGRPVRIGTVRLNPWSLGLTLRDVSVGGAQPADPPQFAAKRLHARLELQSLLRLAPVVGAIQADDPALRLRHLGNGHYDVDDVLARLASGPTPPPDEKPTRYALHNIAVQGGRITFIDDPAGRTHEVRDLRLALPFISNLPSQHKIHVTPHLSFTVDGSRFDSSAQVLPFDASRRTQARLRLERFDLAPYLAYQPANLPVRLAAGTLDADLRLTFEETPRPSLKVTGTLNLSGAKLNDAAGAPALTFERLAVEANDVRPLEHAVHLSSVELSAPRVQASRDAQGRINWVPAAKATPKPAATAAKSAGGDDWQFTVDRLAITQGDLQWRDAAPAPGAAGKTAPATLHVTPFTLQAQQLAWPARQPATFSARLALADVTANAPAGQAPATPAAPAAGAPFIALQGQAQMSAAKVSVQARGLPLQLAQPYLAAVLAPKLAGAVDADADLAWNAPGKADKTAGTGMPGLSADISKLSLSRLTLLGQAGSTDDASRAASRRPADDLPPGTLASIDALTLEGAKLDLPGRSVAVNALTVQAPRLRVARGRDGRWMFEDWLIKSGAGQPSDAPSPSWAVRLGHLAVADGGIGWRDRQPASGTVDVALSQLKLDVRNFDLDGHKPMPLELSALLTPRRGEPGKLDWRGTVGLAPVSAEGEIDAERLPLQAFEPYVADWLNINILRADTSFKGKVDYAQQSAGPYLRLTGDARIEELRTTSHPGSAAANDAAPGNTGTKTAPAARHPKTAASGGAPQPTSSAALAPAAETASGGLGEELLSWKQLRVAGLRVRLDPDRAPRVTVKDSRLSDFYARIIVHPNGRINLQDLVKTAAPAQAASAPASAPASGASGAQDAADQASGAPVIRFGPTHLVNGRVAFSDHFIRPNYSADLSELSGTLGAFRSVTDPQAPQMANLQLAGKAEGTAQLTVNGQLNPLAQPLALDIKAQVTDLELPPLSPYAVKYSGHGIERGKLSMDVAYKIAPDGQLTAANKLILNQLQFGEQVPGAPASLPVSLATTLLADSNGVIHLDLPISGSLNDPQFSLGPVIFKAIMNLIGKAITAPFSLLANALGGSGGGGGDLSQVPFAPGSAVLSDAAKAQLDKITQAMADRPSLKLTVIGAARLDAEREGFKRERLNTLVAAERRARGTDASAATPDAAAQPAPAASEAASDAAPAASAPPSVASAASGAADYPQLLRRLYRRADIPGKPRNLIGLTKDMPVAQMEAHLLEHINVRQDDMRQLATQRAAAVKDYLLAQRLSADRVFIGAARIDSADSPGNTAQGATPASAAEPASAAATAAPAVSGWTPHAALELGTR